MEILAELTEIFREVFDDDSIELTRQTTANDIDAWDSLSHMNMVMAVELRFKVRFALGELPALRNVGDLADLVAKKLARK
ncbi:acyl carrier protein [Geomonas limicola]|uniref:Acyl carrier protein n=1 Tax=Geomonas limicola TaxID=2740186 RepID=A0A6V8N4S5_9BACT|nr:acyl carrier protein [Geomonas limicola]GFO67380.1 acyl carrier protein [Geomonas limicola]